MNESDPKNGDIKAIQRVQNKMSRFLNFKTLKDEIPSKTLLKNINMLSVNQLNAKIKIIEIWKSMNVPSYPLKIETKVENKNTTNTRAMSANTPIEIGKRVLTQRTCISDAIKIWNQIPENLQNATSIYSIKKLAKQYAFTLPI